MKVIPKTCRGHQIRYKRLYCYISSLSRCFAVDHDTQYLITYISRHSVSFMDVPIL